MKSLKIQVLSVLLLVPVLIGSPFRAAAQSVYSAIHGTVTDSSGATVPNASVVVTNTSTGIQTKTTTDSKGYYTLPQLQPGGPYEVKIEATGFKEFTNSGFTLNVNDNHETSAKMEVGSGNTTVEVSATALQVETSDTQLKQVVTAQQLEQIPLFGRDASGLQKLSPGVVESSDRYGNFSSNGNQTTQNSYLLNGTDINDGALQNEGITVNPDALSEENVLTSTMNPEFARNSGAVVNQIIKSGTNTIHGNAFEYYRDSFMNATPYLATKPNFHQNLYGGTVGFPVIKNKLFGFLGYQGLRNRVGNSYGNNTFSNENFTGDFTADSNYFTGGSNSAGLSNNPLPFAVNGCAAGTAWNQCFANGSVVVPTSQWNPLALNFTNKYIPHPNQSDSTYLFNTANTSAQDQGIIRVDFTPSASDSISAYTLFQSSPSNNTLSFGGGSFPGFGEVNAEHFKLFGAAWTHTFNPSTLNELRAGYYRFNYASVQPQNPALPSSYGFTGITPQDTAAAGFPYLSIGTFALGNSFEGPQPRLDSNLSFGDNFTKIIGGHTLKFGALWEQMRVDNPFSYYNNGEFDFNGGGQYSSGDPFIDFALGIPDDYNQTSNGDINAMSSEIYAYGQDSWKVSNDVTVNFGLAWDVEKPTTNAQFGGLGINCWANTSATSNIFPGAAPGLFFPGDPGCNRAGGPTTHYNRFAPRVGLAWSPSEGPSFLLGAPGEHKFSVRMGYGIYYNRDQEEQSLQNLEDPPFFFFSQGALAYGGSPAFATPFSDVTGNAAASGPNQFPFVTPKAGDTNIDWADLYSYLQLATFDKKLYTVPYSQNFNITIQRELPGNSVLQIGYVGSLGRHLASWYEGDPITPAGHAACLADPGCSQTSNRTYLHRFYPQYAAQPALTPGGSPWYRSVAVQTTENASNYNALQISLVKGSTHGLSGSVAYTYSHGLDNGSGYESVTGGQGTSSVGPSQIYTPGYQYLNYGDSDYDARHRIAASYVYEVPVFASIRDNRILRNTLSGWEVAGITALQSGFPIGITQGADRSLWCDADSYFGCGDRPNVSDFNIKKVDPRKLTSFNGGPLAHYYFAPTNFSNETIGTFGNAKRNFLHGPGFDYTNLQLSKNFHLFAAHEERYLQLRVEGANVFNHANFASPIGTFNSATFGQVQGVLQSADPNTDPAPARQFQLVGKFFF
jgi:hypothetical protein